MSRNGKVIVAMSGGVDSSVAACLLKEQGHECVGVFLRVGAAAAPERPGPAAAAAAPGATAVAARRLRHGCCSVTDALDARSVAARLGIPLYVLNFEPDFARIIDYFVGEYARARTPNPCVRCNTDLKFGKLLRYADLLDAACVATGHYARTVERNGQVCLARARNLAKDQSYVLFGIPRPDLRRCRFPLGDIADKADVRRLAAALGLPVHDKPDSQEICFVPGGNYRTLVRARRPESQRPGELRDSAGRVLGRHDGLAGFTIGQRRGLGVATGRPVYVTRLDVLSNTVTVGQRAELLSGGLVAENVNWLIDPPPAGAWHPAHIRIRHQHAPAPGRIRPRPDGTVVARFDRPQEAVTPGQAAVFYDADGLVLGGGWIAGPAPAGGEAVPAPGGRLAGTEDTEDNEHG